MNIFKSDALFMGLRGNYLFQPHGVCSCGDMFEKVKEIKE